MNPSELMREYEAASRVHDLSRVLACIHVDAVYWFSNATRYAGKDAIAEAIRSNFEAIKAEDYRIESVDWLVENEDIAVCTYRFVWSGVIAGKPAGGEGRGTSVLVNRLGRWQIMHEHLSKGPV